jgi:hypothetical protein
VSSVAIAASISPLVSALAGITALTDAPRRKGRDSGRPDFDGVPSRSVKYFLGLGRQSYQIYDAYCQRRDTGVRFEPAGGAASNRNTHMTSELQAEQCWEWAILYDKIKSVLWQYGEEDDVAEQKDFLLVDDNFGWYSHRIETNKLELVQPVVVKSLQKLLIGYPNWEIVVALGSFGGLVIRDDEIMDGLRRENLPKEFQTIEYEGSRPQGSRFGDIMYSGSGPF